MPANDPLAAMFEYARWATLAVFDAAAAAPGALAQPIPNTTRTLANLELDCLPPRTPLPVLRGFRLLRLDLVIKLLRYRRAYHEKTLELARMVGAQAAEKITNTHVRNARDFAELMTSLMPVEKAVAAYLRAFYLPLGAGQVVMQRVKAAVAGSHLAMEYSAGPAPDPELLEEPGAADDLLQYSPAPREILEGR